MRFVEHFISRQQDLVHITCSKYVVLRCMFLRQCGCWWRILDYEATNSVIYHLPSSVERGNGEVYRECSAVNPCMFLDTRFYIFLLTDFDTVRLFSTQKRGQGQVFNAHYGEFLCHCLQCICLLPGYSMFLLLVIFVGTFCGYISRYFFPGTFLQVFFL